jgi:hypothetical protein
MFNPECENDEKKLNRHFIFDPECENDEKKLETLYRF